MPRAKLEELNAYVLLADQYGAEGLQKVALGLLTQLVAETETSPPAHAERRKVDLEIARTLHQLASKKPAEKTVN